MTSKSSRSRSSSDDTCESNTTTSWRLYFSNDPTCSATVPVCLAACQHNSRMRSFGPGALVASAPVELTPCKGDQEAAPIRFCKEISSLGQYGQPPTGAQHGCVDKPFPGLQLPFRAPSGARLFPESAPLARSILKFSMIWLAIANRRAISALLRPLLARLLASEAQAIKGASSAAPAEVRKTLILRRSAALRRRVR